MTTRKAGRSSGRPRAKRPMTWFNDGFVLQALAGNTAITVPLFSTVTMPAGYQSGFTILRTLIYLTWGPTTVATVVNALFALYVDTRLSLTVPPNLVSDLVDYYFHAPVASASSPAAGSDHQLIDIRTKRRIRGEERTLFARMQNTEATLGQFGMRMRFLITPS